MTKIVKFTEAEVAEPGDFEAISDHAREGDENITGGAIGYPSHWADFTISTPSSVTVQVNPGRYFLDATIYDLDEALDLDMQVHLPLVIGDLRYVAILARGIEETVNENRMVETDVDTGETVQQSVPKTNRRRVEFVVQQGTPSPTPVKPSIAANDCCVAFIMLSATGIEAVESGEDWRVKTLYEVEGRTRVLEGQMIVAFQRTTTLQTDLANVQSRFNSIPRPEVIRQLQRDAARTRRLLGLPDATRAYFYDPGLVTDKWDTAHIDWLARIREGVRFAFASERDAQLAVLNPSDPAISITDNVLMPAYVEERRVEVDGGGSFKNISQQVHTITTAVERTVSRSSVEYGVTVAVCENQSEWSQVGAARVGETFQVNGETFVNTGVITDPAATLDMSNFVYPEWDSEQVVAHNLAQNNQPGHQVFAAQSVQTRSWTETYWDYVVEEFGVNGSVYGQTFLVTQPMIMTSIELPFSRVDSAGSVHLLLTEVSETGAPVLSRVLARTEVVAGGLSVGWVKFPFTPTMLPAGRRYAWVTVTTGNHAIRTVNENKYAQGTLFYSTDEAWFQGSLEEDFCFRINAAKFKATRTVVEMDALTLENGFTQLNLLYENWTPDGTALIWEVMPSGTEAWQLIGPNLDNPFNGLPALTRVRLTMLGTTELSPAIRMTSTARGMTQRHRSDMTAITKDMLFGFNTTSIVIETVVDAYDPARHTVANKVDIDGVVYAPDTTTEEVDISKSTRATFTSTFTVPITDNARLRVDMTTDNVTSIPFIQNVSLFAL